MSAIQQDSILGLKRRPRLGDASAGALLGALTLGILTGGLGGAIIGGAVGGAFGLPALAVELPVSLVVMLRSIADIARSEGESLRDPESKMEIGHQINEDQGEWKPSTYILERDLVTTARINEWN